jgi:Peptidase family S41
VKAGGAVAVRLRRAMRRASALACAAALAVASGSAPAYAADAFDAAPWTADFEQIVSEMSAHYANLESAVTDRKMDLPALKRRTEQRLEAATSEAAAKRAIESFLNAFGDGHVRVEWTARSAPSPAATPTPVCNRLGYENTAIGGIQFETLPEFAAVAGDEARFFPGGVLRLDAGRVVGTLRIQLFAETAYLAVCEPQAAALGLAPNAPCDERCEYRVQLAVGDELARLLARRGRALRAAGATELLVDITGNGGGSNWVDAAMRVLAPKPVAAERFGFVRHPHWVSQLQNRLRSVRDELASTTDARQRTLLRAAETPYAKALSEAEQRCDVSGVWTSGALPACSMIVKDVLVATGALPYAAPGALVGIRAHDVVFTPSRYQYEQSANSLPLSVVVDYGTGSAAEEFAATLQDDRAARIVGEATGGSGCGYTNGGITATLTHSRAVLKLPDCVRFRSDGTNEVAGVVPDRMVPFGTRDSPYQRARKVVRALAGAGPP